MQNKYRGAGPGGVQPARDNRVFISGQPFELTGWRFLGVGTGSRFDPMGLVALAPTLSWQNVHERILQRHNVALAKEQSTESLTYHQL